LIQLMSCANLELGKWVSNTSFIQRDDTDEELSPIKILGLYWLPGKGTLTYNISLAASPDCTKRQVLSDVSGIFDPLGLLAPIVIQFKIIFQKLWLLNLDWDDPLPITTLRCQRRRQYRGQTDRRMLLWCTAELQMTTDPSRCPLWLRRQGWRH